MLLLALRLAPVCASTPFKAAHLLGLRRLAGKSVTRSLAQPPWALGSGPPPRLATASRRTERPEKEVRVWKEAQRVSGCETDNKSR